MRKSEVKRKTHETEIVCEIMDSSIDELGIAKTIMITIADKHVPITNFLIIVI